MRTRAFIAATPAGVEARRMEKCARRRGPRHRQRDVPAPGSARGTCGAAPVLARVAARAPPSSIARAGRPTAPRDGRMEPTLGHDGLVGERMTDARSTRPDLLAARPGSPRSTPATTARAGRTRALAPPVPCARRSLASSGPSIEGRRVDGSTSPDPRREGRLAAGAAAEREGPRGCEVDADCAVVVPGCSPPARALLAVSSASATCRWRGATSTSSRSSVRRDAAGCRARPARCRARSRPAVRRSLAAWTGAARRRAEARRCRMSPRRIRRAREGRRRCAARLTARAGRARARRAGPRPR
jgi:hypothetical protein